MPTLHHRSGDSGLHPCQTDYFIIAHPPELGYITYQIHGRARHFIVNRLGYGDEDEISWSIVRPLRHIGDLFTVEEGGPGRVDPTENKSSTTPQVTSQEAKKLAQYFESHPDVTGDFGEFKSLLSSGQSEYIDSVDRDGYTPMSSPGHSDGTGNDSLDRIANRYFGDETDAIEWNGQRVVDYIEVEDLEGEVHKFPKIEERLPEAEAFRLSKDLYERWGPLLGESKVNSRQYEPEEDGFPNQWIGQREGSPEPNLEEAKSPLAFFYRKLAGRSGRAPGAKLKRLFEESCDYSLTVYKANFTNAVAPQDFSKSYITIERATKPWNDFQIPKSWTTKYIDNDGLPPLHK